MSWAASRHALATLGALFCLSASPGAFADDGSAKEEARRLYNEAKKAMSDKNYQQAALAFEGASMLIPHAVALYTAAQAWELAGSPARAADAYTLALDTPKLSDAQAQRSRERLTDLQKQLGVLVVAGPPGVRVRIADHMELEPPARLHGAPGEQTVSVIRPSGATETRRVVLSAGESTKFDTEEGKAEEAAEATPEPNTVPLSEPQKKPIVVETQPKSPWRTIGYFTTGAGLAALGGGALLGLSAKDAEETYKAAPTRETLDHARGLESKTNIMFIAGGVLTAAGVGLLVWESTKKKESPPSESRQLSVRVAGSQLFAEGQF